jgi:hypothetical protein
MALPTIFGATYFALFIHAPPFPPGGVMEYSRNSEPLLGRFILVGEKIKPFFIIF